MLNSSCHPSIEEGEFSQNPQFSNSSSCLDDSPPPPQVSYLEVPVSAEYADDFNLGISFEMGNCEVSSPCSCSCGLVIEMDPVDATLPAPSLNQVSYVDPDGILTLLSVEDYTWTFPVLTIEPWVLDLAGNLYLEFSQDPIEDWGVKTVEIGLCIVDNLGD